MKKLDKTNLWKQKKIYKELQKPTIGTSMKKN